METDIFKFLSFLVGWNLEIYIPSFKLKGGKSFPTIIIKNISFSFHLVTDRNGTRSRPCETDERDKSTQPLSPAMMDATDNYRHNIGRLTLRFTKRRHSTSIRVRKETMATPRARHFECQIKRKRKKNYRVGCACGCGFVMLSWRPNPTWFLYNLDIHLYTTYIYK